MLRINADTTDTVISHSVFILTDYRTGFTKLTMKQKLAKPAF